ncbi:MAG: hypothetical protein HYY34_03125 [Chloroflexi bacterium]|nr:hypothetical protein [Chloroflexota bacterium]
MQLAGIPGIARTRKLWLPTGWQAVRRIEWPVAGLVLAAGFALWRVGWNLAHPHDLFLDSWVLVHIMRVLDGDADPLPRSVLTLQYPLAYLPFVPFAKIFGPFATVKVIYAVAACLAAVPSYMLVRRGPMPAMGAVAILFIPDVVAKSLTGTPQGIAFPLFLLALYFALRRRRLPFVIAATAVLFTHHLTGLVTMVLYYATMVVPDVRNQGFLRREWPYLVYFGAWPFWWAWTFSNIDQSYLGPMMLVLVVGIGLPLAFIAYAAAPWLRSAVERSGERIASRGVLPVVVTTLAFAAISWLLAGAVVDSPGLSSSAIANRTVVAVYGAALALGFAAALARKDVALTSFILALLALGAATVLTGCQRVFDGLRLADFAAAGSLVALFAPASIVFAPASSAARWVRRPLLVAIAVLLIAAGLLRMQSGYERLFAHTEGQAAAARWISENLPAKTSIATDTKMSLMVLGAGDHNATFEGTWWLFSGEPISPYVAALNRSGNFKQRPVEYALLADYMFDRGAEVAWFVPARLPDPGLTRELDDLGERVYDQDGITIWKLDGGSIARAAGPAAGSVSFNAGLPPGRLALFGGLCR